MNIYQEQIIDHYRNPRHHGMLNDAGITIENYNPSCGDSVTVYATIKGGKLFSVAFTGKGCVISQAAASMLLAAYTGKAVEVVAKLTQSDMLRLLGITLGPTRMRCALLALEALQKGIQDYERLS